jgi:hypothetical protein
MCLDNSIPLALFVYLTTASTKHLRQMCPCQDRLAKSVDPQYFFLPLHFDAPTYYHQFALVFYLLIDCWHLL